MIQKKLLSDKIYEIAEYLNVSKKDIKLIITSFLIYRQRELLNGKEIRIVNFIEILPEPILDSDISTIAFVAKEISDVLDFSYHTVGTILNAYLRIQYEQLEKGNPVDFRGIVKIHPKIKDNRIVAIHSSISTVVTNAVIEEGRLNSVRVHTAKSLKQRITGKEVLTDSDLEYDLDEDEEIERMFA